MYARVSLLDMLRLMRVDTLRKNVGFLVERLIGSYLNANYHLNYALGIPRLGLLNYFAKRDLKIRLRANVLVRQMR